MFCGIRFTALAFWKASKRSGGWAFCTRGSPLTGCKLICGYLQRGFSFIQWAAAVALTGTSRKDHFWKHHPTTDWEISDKNLKSLSWEITQGTFPCRLYSMLIQILQMRISCQLVTCYVIYFHPRVSLRLWRVPCVDWRKHRVTLNSSDKHNSCRSHAAIETFNQLGVGFSFNSSLFRVLRPSDFTIIFFCRLWPF